MKIEDYLLDELKRLNRMNDLFEKNINQDKFFNNEPEKIKNNALTICEIVKTIRIH